MAGVSRRRAVIFDLDGVLIDSEGLQYKAYSEVLARFGVSVTAAEYAEHWVAAGRGPEHAVATYQLKLAPGELRQLKQSVYFDILRRQVTLLPGVVGALQRLQPHYGLAVATNSIRRDVSFVLDHFDLRRFFTAVVTREDYEKSKPDPDAYLAAAAQLQTPTAHCLVVEDSHRGLVAAHRAKAIAVAVPNSFTRGSDFSLAAQVLQSLEELTPALVEQLLGASTD